jgi:hypothetical protein
METVSVRVDTLQRLISKLQDAVNVCYNVDSSDNDDYEKNYPYATGYSRGAMNSVIDDLNNILNKCRN